MRAVARRFITDKPPFQLLAVRLGLARGKSNVLAHLTSAATGDYFLFTDADMAVPPGWVRALLAAAQPGVGIMTGITTTGGLFGRLQGLDCLFGLSLMRLLTHHSVPVAAVSNNMLVTRAAYESSGGYEVLSFSASEDLQLFRQVVKQGWQYRNLIAPHTLAVSQPTRPHLLRQRKRWMSGATRLPWQLEVLFSLYGAFHPVLSWPGLLPLPSVAALYGGKLLDQTLFLAITLLYNGYLLAMSPAIFAYTAWPTTLEWRARRYRWAEA